MKNQISTRVLTALTALMLCVRIAPVLLAQTSAPAPASASQAAPVQLSAEVWDVLRLAHGGVSDAIVTAYVKNAGKTYALGPSEILYLREQGLSDAVLTAMLDQRRTAAAAPSTAPHVAWEPSVSTSNSTPPEPPAVTQPAPAYVQPAPVYSQPAPVYVYPPSYSYYDSWPYYGSYWGYPSVSIGFGYWGGHYGGGYYGHGYHGGGYYGGGHYGGGYHGGGHSAGFSGGSHSGGGHSGGGGGHR